ncbi:MAG: biotin/lipoyl-binding protein [Thermoanaerobaculaceae bacterium]|nr:biotin/lipoyl-binding protein [Thermoanaerobaculaceae bacterium]MDI9621818.1 biotin/lipoyl-binding protein [Acidobacteriota bacterium]NLH34384.1 biotin/lipoyl-binding protein [Lentimicrobium sp.]HPW54467.1 biotin/lipoyl-binding protein [Thermoanaerobaculaceae bacterium]
MREHVLRIDGHEYRAEVKELTPERAVVVVDGKEYGVDLVQIGRRRVSGEVARVAPAPPPSAPPVVVVPSAVARPAAPAAGGGGITAPMPGLIVAVKAKEGETVQAGQTLLVMEAMKMENAITAAYAGIVARIYVREGDSVGEGDLLVDVSRPKMTTL